jgi:hypothetical protein
MVAAMNVGAYLDGFTSGTPSKTVAQWLQNFIHDGRVRF